MMRGGIGLNSSRCGYVWRCVWQGELESMVEVVTMPLSTFPAQAGPQLPSPARPTASAQAAPQPQRQSLQCRRFYHALVLHRELPGVLDALGRVQTQSAGLLRKVTQPSLLSPATAVRCQEDSVNALVRCGAYWMYC